MAAEGVNPRPAAFIFIFVTVAIDMLLAAFLLAAFLTRQSHP